MNSVLYIDDEPALFEVTTRFLEKYGKLKVDTAASVTSALEKMKLRTYDAIVSDYQMPEMNGIDLLKLVRASNPTLPFIIFTGRGREEIVIEAFNNGADFYLQKGGDPKSQYIELAHKINQAIRRKKAEEDLRESEERFRSVVETQTEFICRFRPDGTHIFVNDAYLRYFGKSREEVIGHVFRPNIPDEDLPRLKEHFSSLSPAHPDDTIEHRIIIPDGSVRWQRWNDHAIFDSDGTLIEYQSVGRDFSARMQAEVSLREGERQLADIINFLPDATFVINLEGRCLVWNRSMERMTGIPATEMVGRGKYEYALPFYKERRPILIDLVFRRDEETEAKYPYIKRDGMNLTSEILIPHFHDGKGAYLWFTASPLYNTHGDIIGAIESIRDITLQKESELDLSRRNEELRTAYEHLAAVEEDLRNRHEDLVLAYEALTQSQKALAESEATLNSIIGESPIPQFVIDEDHRVIHWNRALAEYSGVSANAVLGTTEHWRAFYDYKRPCMADLLVDGQYDKIGTWYEGKFEKSSLIEDAYRATDFFPRMAGRGKWLSFTAGLVRDREGKILGAVETLEDITHERQAKEALRESEARLQALYDENPTMFFTIDSGGKVLSVNPYGAEQLGFSVAELLGQPVLSVFHPDDRESVQAQIAICLQRPGEVVSWEFRKVRKDGTIIWVREAARSVRQSDGSPVLFIVCEDITHERQAGEALRESEANYRAIIENMQEMVYRTDRDGNLTMISPEGVRLAGYGSKEEMIGLNIARDIYANPDERKQLLAALAEKGSVNNFIITLKERDGTPHIVSASSHYYYDAQGNVLGVEGILHDLTDRKRSEDALRIANRQLHLLTMITRHDILNKILIILGNLDLIREKTRDAGLLGLVDKLDAATRTIQDEIEFTRTYQNIGAQKPRWQKINNILTQCSVPQSIRLRDEIPSIEIVADPMLGKVFLNLLDNSIRHGGNVTTLRMSGAETEEGFVVSWEDDGIGILPEEKEKIFELGYGKNTGLGLFLAREILSITGITIRETGEAGKGARFEIVVPKGAYRA